MDFLIIPFSYKWANTVGGGSLDPNVLITAACVPPARSGASAGSHQPANSRSDTLRPPQPAAPSNRQHQQAPHSTVCSRGATQPCSSTEAQLQRCRTGSAWSAARVRLLRSLFVFCAVQYTCFHCYTQMSVVNTRGTAISLTSSQPFISQRTAGRTRPGLRSLQHLSTS